MSTPESASRNQCWPEDVGRSAPKDCKRTWSKTCPRNGDRYRTLYPQSALQSEEEIEGSAEASRLTLKHPITTAIQAGGQSFLRSLQDHCMSQEAPQGHPSGATFCHTDGPHLPQLTLPMSTAALPPGQLIHCRVSLRSTGKLPPCKKWVTCRVRRQPTM